MDCKLAACSSVSRYDYGVHIPQPGVVHDDPVSPWTGDFNFSAIFTGSFWEHAFTDVIGGTLFVPVFSF
jgi:hypothetical protein